MSLVVAWLVVGPLAAGVALFILSRWPRLRLVRAATALGAQGAITIAALWTLFTVADGTYLVHRASDWPPPYGIVLVADRLGALMVTITAVVFLLTLLYSLTYVPAGPLRATYLPLYFFLATGVHGAFLTGDLFNLFVFFEVMLLATYGLVVTPDAKGLVSQAEKFESVFRYIVLNLIGAAFFLLSIGALYGTLGTLNFADLHVRIQAARAAGITHIEPIALVLLAVFALKAAAVPVHFWLPDVHPSAPSPISAILSGILIKVGAYAIIRLTTLLYPGLDLLNVALFGIAFATMFVGGFGALAQVEVKRLLAYSSISQMGFILLGIALNVQVALAAAIFFLVNHAIIKSLLFLAAGGVLEETGERSMERMGGLAAHRPFLAGSFIIGFFALAGVPPLNGFVSKLLIFDALALTRLDLIVPVLAAAILSVLYSVRAWQKMFWGPPTREPSGKGLPRPYLASILALATLCIVLGVVAGPLIEYSNAAAAQLVDPGGYVEAVLGVRP